MKRELIDNIEEKIGLIANGAKPCETNIYLDLKRLSKIDLDSHNRLMNKFNQTKDVEQQEG